MSTPQLTSDNYVRCQTLEKEITQLAAHVHAATYRLLCLIREFDTRGGWGGMGVLSCAHWLNWQCGIGLSAAREKVRVAHALGQLPKISDAFAKGEVSYSKVRAMTRVANPANEDYLLMVAHHGTATHVERLVRAYRGVERREERARAERQHDERELTYYTDEDGALVIQARLPAERGAVVLQALQGAMDALSKAEPTGDELSTDPSAEGFGDATEERPNICQRRADGLVLMAETLLEGGAKSSTSGERYQVVVHVAAETLQAGAAGRCAIEDGPVLAADTAQRLACDSSIVLLVEDEDGQPLSIGRKTRAIPPAIRRALRARDGGCRFPGCTHRHFIHAHHIAPWAEGGESALENLVQLCQYHHRLVHESGYGCRLSDTGDLCFTRPDGRPLHTVAPRLVPDTGTTLEEESHKHGLHVNPDTCVPKWHGEVMDYGMGVDGLLQCAGRLNGPPPSAYP